MIEREEESRRRNGFMKTNKTIEVFLVNAKAKEKVLG
jgi:hypothetical protein